MSASRPPEFEAFQAIMGQFLDAMDLATDHLRMQSEELASRRLGFSEGLALQAIALIHPNQPEFTAWHVWQVTGRKHHTPIYGAVKTLDTGLDVLNSRSDPDHKRRTLYTPTKLGLQVLRFFDPDNPQETPFF